jgi:cellulose synthase/poly-beta-1,6-N-acetylglucosamine synthase-like glycosyltransferase
MTLADVAFVLLLVFSIPTYFLALELLTGLLPYRAKRYPAAAGSCAIIIPAHNEEITLGATLASIKEQASADERIIVVADNCTDATATIAAQMGAEVLERFDTEKRGKGYALAHAIEYVRHSPVDIVMFVDADCRAETGSIATLKSACATYNNPVQSRYQFYAPPGAPAARTISEFALYIKNHVRLLGLHRLGGSVPITGSGFAMPFELMQSFDLNTGNIVEDMKLGVDIALSGRRVMYVPEAQISTSLPLTNADAHKQRTRWEHGHIATILRYCPGLLATAIRTLSKTRLLTALDLTVAPIFVLLTIGIIMSGVGITLGSLLSDVRLLYTALIPLVLVVTGLAAINWHAKIVSLRQLPDIFIYALVKVDISRKFFSGRKSGWEKTKRDQIQE